MFKQSKQNIRKLFKVKLCIYLQKYNNWVCPFHWLGVDLNLFKALGHTWDPVGLIAKFFGAWEARKKRWVFLLHAYSISKRGILEKNCIRCKFQWYNFLALWRVINVDKDFFSLFPLCPDLFLNDCSLGDSIAKAWFVWTAILLQIGRYFFFYLYIQHSYIYLVKIRSM